MRRTLSPIQRERLYHWYPALITAVMAWTLFTIVGHTPFVRSLALSIVILAVSIALRRLGAAFAIIGGIAFALSPAFWAQTGGTPTPNSLFVLQLAAAATAVALFILFLRRRLFSLLSSD